MKVTEEEGSALGLTRREVSYVNATEAILSMLNEFKSMTQEQRDARCLQVMAEAIERLGYYAVPNMYDTHDYQYAVKKDGDVYVLFRCNHRVWNTKKPVVRKSQRDRVLGVFLTLDDARAWAKKGQMKLLAKIRRREAAHAKRQAAKEAKAEKTQG